MSVFSELEQAAARYAGRTFLHVAPPVAERYGIAARDYSFTETLAEAASRRARFVAAGIGAGVRVGVALENRPAFLFNLYALNALGASVVPVNVEMQPPEQQHLIEHSDMSLLVVTDATRDHFTALTGSLARPVSVVGDDPAAVLPPTDYVSAAPPGEAALMYTSGTTGKPKGCMLSNDYFVALGQRYLDMGGLCALEPGAERLVTPLPLTHMNALACSMMAMLMAGGCLVQLDRFHPRHWWETVRDARATIIHYLGVMPAMLLNLPPRADDDFSGRIKFGFGAGCDPRHQAAFERRFGFPLIEAWAMTETGAGAWISAEHEPRHVGMRCFGKAPDHLEYRLIDEQGRDVPAGEPGELLVRRRGPDARRFFFSGYYKDDAATEAAWAGGFFHTGDVVRIGEDDSFFFVDRRKNVIRRSGENIAAVEVEGVLFQHPAVVNCAVTAVPDEVRGEEVMALAVIAEDQTPDADLAQSIVRHALSELAYFKVPGYLAFVADLPKTASEKVQRGQVKETARRLLADGACFDMTGLKKRPARDTA